MKLRNIILMITIVITYGCGFSSIYSNNNYNFSIEKITFQGDNALNNYTRSNLIKYQDKKNEVKFFINAETNYEKNVLTKSKTGKITNYELVAEIIFNVQPVNKKITFKKEKIMESMSDKFQERKYEKIIKQNFAKSFSDSLVFELQLLK